MDKKLNVKLTPKLKYDAICKSLLAKKYTLARIMQSCLPEYQGCSLENIANKYIEGQPEISTIGVMPNIDTNINNEDILIDGLANEETSVKEGRVVYDIRFKALAPKEDGYISLIINVEAQADFYPGYPLIKRGIYYCSRMISAQYNREFTHSHYEKIKKVISIWVCTEPPQERTNTINRYSVAEYNIVGGSKEPQANYDLLSVFIIGLGNPRSKDYNGILKYLDVLLSKEYSSEEKEKILCGEFSAPIDLATKGDLAEMCNLGQAIEDKALRRGIEQGRIEGRNEGKNEGRFEERLANIQTLMATVGWSAEQAMDALNIQSDEREKYLEHIKRVYQ